MKYIKLFEDYNEYPEFDYLWRGLKGKIISNEFEDDPSKRKINLGIISGQENHMDFVNSISKFMPDPSKSIHMILSDVDTAHNILDWFGSLHKVLPKSSAKFGILFKKIPGFGGMGNLYFNSHSVSELYLDKDYSINKDTEIEEMDRYISDLVNKEVIKEVGYSELVEISKNIKKGDFYYVWTQDTCLVKKLNPKTEKTKDKPIINGKDIINLGFKPGKIVGKILNDFNKEYHHILPKGNRVDQLGLLKQFVIKYK